MTDYAIPIQVNGYTCRNCTDVANAKKNVDPQRPQDGPFGVNRTSDTPGFAPEAVRFGGALAGLDRAAPSAAIRGEPTRRLDVTA